MHKANKIYISPDYMHDICEHNRKVAFNRWNKILVTSLERFKNNSLKYPALKARIVGYLIGDGSVSIHVGPGGGIHHSVDFYPDDDFMLKAFIEAFVTIYDVIPKIKNLGNYFSVRISSKPIAVDLMKTSSFKSLEWKVPKFSSVEEKIEFLRAVYDCEGHVGKKVIAIQSVNKTGLEDIKLLLEEFDINARLYSYRRKNMNWNINYLLYISNKDSRKNFLKHIGFSHSKKQHKLMSYADIA